MIRCGVILKLVMEAVFPPLFDVVSFVQMVILKGTFKKSTAVYCTTCRNIPEIIKNAVSCMMSIVLFENTNYMFIVYTCL